tara:strand:- start:514 stop:639 length:126 start_codon:yes stop_codon:yes gene_type:complete
MIELGRRHRVVCDAVVIQVDKLGDDVGRLQQVGVGVVGGTW